MALMIFGTHVWAWRHDVCLAITSRRGTHAILGDVGWRVRSRLSTVIGTFFLPSLLFWHSTLLGTHVWPWRRDVHVAMTFLCGTHAILGNVGRQALSRPRFVMGTSFPFLFSFIVILVLHTFRNTCNTKPDLAYCGLWGHIRNIVHGDGTQFRP